MRWGIRIQGSEKWDIVVCITIYAAAAAAATNRAQFFQVFLHGDWTNYYENFISKYLQSMAF